MAQIVTDIAVDHLGCPGWRDVAEAGMVDVRQDFLDWCGVVPEAGIDHEPRTIDLVCK